MIPAELLGLTPYHPHMDNGMLDAVQKDEQLAQQKEIAMRQLAEEQQHNRASEDVASRGLDVRQEHDKLVAAIANKKLDRKLPEQDAKTWHQYNLLRIRSLAAGDDRAAAQYESMMDGLTAGAELQSHDVAPQPETVSRQHQGMAGPAFQPALDPTGGLGYDFSGGVARTSKPGVSKLPEAETSTNLVPPGGPGAPPAAPPRPEGRPEGFPEPFVAHVGEAQYDPNAIVREGLAKKRVVELPEQSIDRSTPTAPIGAVDPNTYGPPPGDMGGFPLDYQAMPQETPAAAKRTLAMPGGKSAALAASENPEVDKVAMMYRDRASGAEGPQKKALEAAASAAALSRNPKDAEMAGERAFKNAMEPYKKVGAGGGGAPAGESGFTDKQLSTMSKDTLQIINTVKSQHGVSVDVKGFNAAKSALSLVAEGERTGFGDTAATAAIVKSFNGANSSDKELGRFLAAAGKFEEAQNIINQYTNGNLKTDEYIRQMRGMLNKATAEYQRQMSAAADEAEGFARARFRGTPQEEEQAGLVRQAFEGGVWKPSAAAAKPGKGGHGTSPELARASSTAARYEEFLRKNGGKNAH